MKSCKEEHVTLQLSKLDISDVSVRSHFRTSCFLVVVCVCGLRSAFAKFIAKI